MESMKTSISAIGQSVKGAMTGEHKVVNTKLIRFSGYQVDINNKTYNTMGKVGGNDVTDWYLDLNKGMEVDPKTMEIKECRIESNNDADPNLPTCDVGTSRYRPIGLRVGTQENKFNTVFLGNLGYGHGNYTTDDGETKKADEKGIIVGGGSSGNDRFHIFMNPEKAPSKSSNVRSVKFFEDLKKWKCCVNEKGGLLVGVVGCQDRSDCDFSEQELTDAHSSIQKLNDFIKQHCSPSNKKYHDFKKLILTLHTTFNFVDWRMEGHLSEYPLLVATLGRAYHDLNREISEQGFKDRLWYTLSIPSTLGGFNETFVKRWRDLGMTDVLKNDNIQRPWMVGYLVSDINETEWDRNIKDIHEKYVMAPYSNTDTFDILKQMFLVPTADDVKKRLFNLTLINHEEPMSSSTETPNRRPINRDFVGEVSKVLISQGFAGLILLSDRIDCHFNSVKKCPPANIEYDETLSAFYKNQEDVKEILDLVGFKSQEITNIERIAHSMSC
ncbi:hypothetical protein CYY_005590 [Polysphondylium violaceum]|uniref:Uncharacterized protein n=1 Tax=Polysphondylium violaceum TaxID=133409 RepID=A0A8J4UYL8_9MYCE|nr:hypothetical protein CYY_005590 [Polysphondylium violaceum]